MPVLERIFSGEVINSSTLLGAIFYPLLFLILAWLAAYSLCLTLNRLEKGLLDRTTARFFRSMGSRSCGCLV